MVMIGAVLKPTSALCSAEKVLTNSEAPMSRTSESATSATTSALRRRLLRTPAPAPRAPSFNASCKPLRDA